MTNSEKELMEIKRVTGIEEYAKDIAKLLLENNKSVEIKLHKIDYIKDGKISYDLDDLFSKL